MSSMTPRMGQAGHTAGIFADMSLDGPEIGTLVAVIDRAKNLPNRKTMGKQNPYCAMRLGKDAKKTETDRRGGQTPKWDQELRFTVHESPDYYKLKCSIFNDDKKTDLIGEGWIDLKEVVKSGGGTNDLWHQLQFKGKYAGEVRIELTYYDTRPKDESVVLKRRPGQRSGSESTSASTATGVSAPRQFGPREVKRRPLPPNPGGAASPARPSMPEQVHSAPVPLSAPDHSQGFHDEEVDSWTPDREQHASQSPSTPTYHDPDRLPNDYQPSPRGHSLPAQVFQSPPDYNDHSPNGDYQDPSDHSPLSDEFNPVSNSSNQPPYHTPTHERRRSTQSGHPSQTNSPYSNTPPNAFSPQEFSTPGVHPSTPGSGDQRRHFPRLSASPTKPETYRDSPLRQSISHHDVSPQYDQRNLISDDEGPPPPPPAHRDTLSGPMHQPRSPHTPEPLQFSPETRSPLQTIERNYDPFQNSGSPANSPAYQAYSKPKYVPVDPRSRQNSYPNPNHGTENVPPSLRAGYDKFMAATGELGSTQNMRNRHYPNEPADDSRGRESQSNYYQTPPYEQAVNSNDRRLYRTELPMIQTRAVSPDPRNIVPRKSVSPQPQPSPEPEEKRLNGIPFGPDSYDVLNPATSTPPANSSPARYQTPEQAKEAARQREVEKLREIGPIIGNDGRIIDPSDHLPTDTWAPEPERKNRKPEVVIRFRARDETPRTPNANGSSPVSARGQMTASPTYGNSPHQMDSPGLSAAESRQNRYHKQRSNRPLPVQPFQHPHSSPAVPTVVSTPPHGRSPAKQGMPARPALSEYSVPTHRNFGDVRGSPSGSPYSAGPPPLPAKIPLQNYGQPQAYGGYGGYDPLSAELSSIDIGAGSGGRGNGRSWRG